MRLKSVSFASMLAACVSVAASPEAMALKYKVADLGGYSIYALSEQGEVVGAQYTGGAAASAIYWPASGAPLTYACPSGPASTESILVRDAGPSVAGDVVVTCSYYTLSHAGDFSRTFRWNVKTGQATELPGMIVGQLVTQNGLMVQAGLYVEAYDLSSGQNYRIDSTTAGYVDKTTYITVTGADAAGNLYVTGLRPGTAATGGAMHEVELWRPGVGVKKLFGSNAQFLSPVVSGVSAKGLVTGRAQSPKNRDDWLKPYVWLPKFGYYGLPAGFSPVGVNDSIQVLGSLVDATGTTSTPTIWRPLLGVQKLDSLLDAQSKAYTITRPMFINGKGQIAAYASSTGFSGWHAVLLTPSP